MEKAAELKAFEQRLSLEQSFQEITDCVVGKDIKVEVEWLRRRFSP